VKTRVTTEDVRGLLADPKIFPDLPRELDDDAELMLDSMGLVWLLHQLELRFGVLVDPAEEQLAEFTSVRRITEYLASGR